MSSPTERRERKEAAAVRWPLIFGPTGLMSERCECGREKPARKSFCTSCWKALPGDVKNGLYKRIGEGYEEAHARARAILKGDV